MVLEQSKFIAIACVSVVILYLTVVLLDKNSAAEAPPTEKNLLTTETGSFPKKKQKDKHKYVFSEGDLDKARKIDVLKNDVIVFLHIQKTSGATFGNKLVNDLVISPKGSCCPGGFQGRRSCPECAAPNGRKWLFW